MDWFETLNPVTQALLATTFTWGVTALGALVVCFFKEVNSKILNTILGFSAGVMIAAAFWSLLEPSIDLSQELGYIAWALPAIGFITGGLFVLISDKFLDKMLKNRKSIDGKGSLKRSILLIAAITIHNIPEGMAVGVAFGGIASGVPGMTLIGAVMLALGIGIQNFPEGAIISMPLKSEGTSKPKAFLYGTLSGIVEPIGAIVTILLTNAVVPILPYLLSFAAGAMIYVVVEELIPESQAGEHSNIGTIGVAIGFVIMMILDVALG